MLPTLPTLLSLAAKAQPLLYFTAQAQPVLVDAAAEYLKSGVLGASVITVSIVCAMLWRKNESLHAQRDADAATHAVALAELQSLRVADVQALQQLRVADAQAVSAQLIKTTQESTGVLTNVTNALNAQSAATTELRSSIDRDRRTGR